ncbi:MAG: hypothetical protein AAF224_09860 [Pseudomonadota bacterium]
MNSLGSKARNAISGLHCGLAMIFVIALGGCATSIQPMANAGAADAAAAERVALVGSAKAISDTVNWTKPAKMSWLTRLSGRDADSGISRDDTLDAYVEELRLAGDPVRSLADHAQTTIAAADALILSAERALESVSPRMSDVAVLEGSIKELRDCRSMYLSALRRIDLDDAATDRAGAAIKAGFDRAVRQIGGLADALADRAAERQISFAAADPTAS